MKLCMSVALIYRKYSIPSIQRAFKTVDWETLTRLGHFRDVHALLGCHEAQNGEDHEASKETGAAVYQGQHERIPVENR